MQQSHEPHSAAANTSPWVLHAIARTALMKRFSAKHDSALQSDPTIFDRHRDMVVLINTDALFGGYNSLNGVT